MKHLYLIPLLAVFTFFSLSAQVSGTVSDDTGMALPGAYVGKTNSQIHTHSDELGRFTLPAVGIGDTLEVIFLGFDAQSRVVRSAGSTLSFELEPATFDLRQVTVNQPADAINVISEIDLALNPVRSSQEILRRVPGLVMGQHAGGGKAEQIFLRGFDIDHGTDLAISVDGMPVNMVSHAHGQGYADLHFLIPETVDKVDFAKGPYYADQGNFATAGYVDFQTKDRLRNSSVSVEAGQFNTLRLVSLLDVVSSKKHNLYVAAEHLLTDGPVLSPQDFNRTNLMAKYSGLLNEADKLTFSLSHFASEWDASGQIPQRAVDAGLISRFGAIDDTEGGNTSRQNAILTYTKSIDAATYLKSTASYTRYDFELFSNFTFFLDDPEFGDQIRQYEDRQMLLLKSELNHESNLVGDEGSYRLGAGLRSDRTNESTLANTINRRTLQDNLKKGDVTEANLFAYADARIELGRLQINPALRLDAIRFGYRDELATTYQNEQVTRAIFSPKLNFIYSLSPRTQVFLKTGKGFHSNDSRLVSTGLEGNVLPAAYGADLGIDIKPLPRLYAGVAAWYLYLQQEFVYVGDAGIVEPSGRTQRAGLDLSLRYQFNDWLYGDLDGTYTYARSIDESEGEDRIPLAPIATASGGFSVNRNDFKGGLRYRYLADRPANEDNSIVADGYFITDLNANYTFGKLTVGAIVENLFDSEWKETQFATESRLRDEPQSVEEIHFTPGTPFYFRGSLTYRF